MKIVNSRLEGEGVIIIGSPNRNGMFIPDTIVIHYTAGPTAESAIDTFLNQENKASAHLVIERDGTITQLVPFNLIAWHAGESSYGNRIGMNQYSIGIEIVNAGRLTKSGDSYLSWFGKEYKEEEVFEGIHRNESTPTYWHRYTEQQIARTKEICELLVKEYNIKYILGHEEISPKRKIDPGPAFPLDKLREKILHPNRDKDQAEPEFITSSGIVVPEKLNIRSYPAFGDNRVAKPLKKDKQVKILEQAEQWYKVAVEIEGWVLKEHVKTAS
jgi:N-acetylmuramoyl-L-alanine amidase